MWVNSHNITATFLTRPPSLPAGFNGGNLNGFKAAPPYSITYGVAPLAGYPSIPSTEFPVPGDKTILYPGGLPGARHSGAVNLEAESSSAPCERRRPVSVALLRHRLRGNPGVVLPPGQRMQPGTRLSIPPSCLSTPSILRWSLGRCSVAATGRLPSASHGELTASRAISKTIPCTRPISAPTIFPELPCAELRLTPTRSPILLRSPPMSTPLRRGFSRITFTSLTPPVTWARPPSSGTA